MAQLKWLELTFENRNGIRRGQDSPLRIVVFMLNRGTLSSQERIDYTNAALCLQKKKANTPSSLAPGAKSRFDDFVATHINQTLTIHYTVRPRIFFSEVNSTKKVDARVHFLLGTDITRGNMSKLYEMSVDTRVLSL